MKLAFEHFTRIDGVLTRHASHGAALLFALNAADGSGRDIDVFTDTVQVYEHNEADIRRASDSVRANALEILRACAGK